VEFSADGKLLISSGIDGTIRRWPLSAEAGVTQLVLHDWGHKVEGVVSSSDVSADGRFVVTTGGEIDVHVIPVKGGPPKTFRGFEPRVLRAAISPDGRILAVPGTVDGHEFLRIWDVETGADSAYNISDVFTSTTTRWMIELEFSGDGTLLLSDGRELVRWDPDSGDHFVLGDVVGEFACSSDESILVSRTRIDRPDDDRATVRNLHTGDVIPLASHGLGVMAVAIDPTGTIAVTANRDGFIRVGKATGETPHHLMSNQGIPSSLAVSPDGRWIASGGTDGTIRLWPMPDLSKPPIHGLPHGEFLTKLKSLTNLRVVPDPDLPGSQIVSAAAPFPGWETVPSW